MISSEYSNELQKLKDLLLSKDLQAQKEDQKDLKKEILKRIEKLETKINSREKFSENLANSREDVIDIIGPMIGKLIKRGMNEEVEKMGRRIDNAKKKFTSIDFYKKGLSNLIPGRAEPKIEMLSYPEIIDIMIIDINTGLLLGKYAKKSIADSDVIAGMFNAIKSFAETAFDSGNNGLNLINYDEYKIKLQQYGSIYYAVIFTGRMMDDFLDLVKDDIDTFTVQNYIPLLEQYPKDEILKYLSAEMQKYFKSTCEKLEKRLSQLDHTESEKLP